VRNYGNEAIVVAVNKHAIGAFTNMEPTTQLDAYPFTPAELERLYAFRQAVMAGFYTDYLSADDAHRPSDTASSATPQTSPPAADA
jgi:hypothetical protein